MKKKNTLLYFLLSISVGFLMYNYIFSDYRYGMMRHHYGYYDGSSAYNYYLNSLLVFIAYLCIVIGTMFLIISNQKSKNNAMILLDDRLSRGEISVEEYKAIKEIITKK